MFSFNLTSFYVRSSVNSLSWVSLDMASHNEIVPISLILLLLIKYYCLFSYIFLSNYTHTENISTYN